MENQARSILSVLLEHGYEAYMVGGYVRDRFLGREVKDIDIATSARPERVQELFARTIPTGLQHGTITVLVDGTPFEVTTYRQESEYVDYRRPAEVRYIDNLLEDLRRRDFTMNAMAMDIEGKVIDPFEGLRDAREGRIRCVGVADERFSEDALRMVRCIRFAAEYELVVADDTWVAIVSNRALLKYVAMERIRAELERMLAGRDPLRALQLLVESGLCHHFKEATDWPQDRWERALQVPAMQQLGAVPQAMLRWALWMLALACDKEEVQHFLKKLTCSGEMIKEISAVVACHQAMRELHSEEAFKREALGQGQAAVEGWLLLLESSGGEGLGAAELPIRRVSQGKRWLEELRIWSLRELQVSGNEIKAMPGIKGPQIRATLERLLAEAALGAVPNENQALLDQVKRWNEERSDES